MNHEYVERHFENSDRKMIGYSLEFFEQEKAPLEEIEKFTLRWTMKPGTFEGSYFKGEIKLTHYSKAKKNCTLFKKTKIEAGQLLYRCRYNVSSILGFLPHPLFFQNLWSVLPRGHHDIASWSVPEEFILLGNKKFSSNKKLDREISHFGIARTPGYCTVSDVLLFTNFLEPSEWFTLEEEGRISRLR